ncbi:phycoerythrin linker protein CpeS homolog [Geminocystis sp. NIES-3708]|uniref:phycobiliprotein lyase n=1 Tax=Geminocystis sp. NIES-3708 TaxID=1615909 RepID=UPI0005FCB943|nr:phycobiliprotein lyase [Geminocystis sp. NIES-3708]BAQ62798.1 phycoerythrin linker protein CpeS homolog [Geminocystis sp. NIES-3708]
MNINTFLDKTAGEWFSQRTTYNISQDEVDNSKANVTINLLSSGESQVTQLCNQYNFNLDLSLGGIFSSWDNSPDWGKPKQQGENLMLVFRDENDDNTGTIFRFLKDNQGLIGKYVLAEDESLTLILEKNNQYIAERIWFANDNLRLRNTVIKDNEQVIQTSFYSEIRKIVSK